MQPQTPGVAQRQRSNVIGVSFQRRVLSPKPRDALPFSADFTLNIVSRKSLREARMDFLRSTPHSTNLTGRFR